MKSLVILLLLFTVSCNAPFLEGDIVITMKKENAPVPLPSGPLAASLTLPFTTGSEANYVLSDPTQIEITGNLVRLKPTIHTDAVQANFNGLAQGMTWDTTNNFLRLNSTTNIFEHGTHWTPQVSEVIAYYKLDEAGYDGTWAELHDSGPYALHGISLATFSNVPGKINNSAIFDGTRVIGTPDYDDFENHSKFSVAFWAKPSNLNGNAQGLVAKRNDYNDNQSFDLFFYTDNKLTVDIDGGDNRFSSNFVFENDKWYHIALTFDGTQPVNNRVRLYINGYLDTVATENSAFIPNYNAYLRFGSLDGTGFYNYHGQIDDVIFWKTTLDYGVIQYLYMKQSPRVSGVYVSRVFDSIDVNSVWPSLSPVSTLPFNKEIPGVNGSELASDYSAIAPNLMNGLLTYWKFNEAAPGAVMDSSGNNHHGTVTGSIEQGDLRGLFSRAAYFTGGEVTIANPFFDNMTEFSISGWVSPAHLQNPAAGTDVSLFGKKDVVEVGLQSGYYCARSHLDNATICAPSTGFTGEWTHIAVTGNASTFSLYINGKLVNSAPHAGGNYGSSANSFHLGSAVWNLSGEHYLGLMDEVSVWSRSLPANEILNLYRRGGQTLYYLVRSCANADCSDQDAQMGFGWKGIGNDGIFPFSENHNYAALDANLVGVGNTKTEKLNLNFSFFPALSITPQRYFQYQVIMSSNDINNSCDYGSGATMCSPELKSIQIGPSYTTTTQTITNTIAVSTTFDYFDLNGFTETLGTNGCAEARYAVSQDGTNFYFYNGTNWTLSNNTWNEANNAAVMNLSMTLFPTAVGVGTLQIKTFLQSNGGTACEIDQISLSGSKN